MMVGARSWAKGSRTGVLIKTFHPRMRTLTRLLISSHLAGGRVSSLHESCRQQTHLHLQSEAVRAGSSDSLSLSEISPESLQRSETVLLPSCTNLLQGHRFKVQQLRISPRCTGFQPPPSLWQLHSWGRGSWNVSDPDGKHRLTFSDETSARKRKTD